MRTRSHPFSLWFLCLAALLLLPLARAAHAAGAIRASISPTVLLADGIATATVTADVRTSSGRPARDGTEVRFYTTAGTITPVAFTSAGVARATLVSSNTPQTANISISVGIDQAILAVPMVSKLVETSVGGRVMRITGKYVAYSEDKKFIQADEQVRLRFRGVEIEANSVQVDINGNTVKALGKVQVSSDDKTLIGERLWLNLRTFEGYILMVGVKRWFSAYGLTDLPEKPKNATPDFELEDLTDSKLLWVGKQANYIIDERVQVQNARAYVGGIKSLRMPFHQSDLNGGGFGESGSDRYIGIGSEGLSVDLPFYVRMTPGSSTAFHVGYGARSGGIGNFTRNRGLSVDLVQKYGFSGASEGEAMLSNMTSFDRWGFAWSHTQQFTKTTRLVTNLQFPEHRDMYGMVNLTSGLPFGTFQSSVSAIKPHDGTLGKTLSFAFETKPRPLANNKAALSFETTFFQRDRQPVRVARGVKVDTPSVGYQSIAAKLRPRTVNLGHGFQLDSAAYLRGTTGNVNNGIGPAFETNIRRPLPNNGFMQFGVNYNALTTVSDLFPAQGRLNGTLSLTYPITSRFRVSAIGSMAFDGKSHHSLLQAVYEFAPKWQFEMLHTMFRFDDFNDYDFQFGISRALGDRNLGLYWSRRDHRILLEFGASRF